MSKTPKSTSSRKRTGANGDANGAANSTGPARTGSGGAKARSNRSAKKPIRSGKKPIPINLGLQGGGAHGAFSWGVIDRILEDGRLEIEGISGTSAGAMNAVVLADALYDGGADEARAKLYQFWRSVSTESLKSPIQRSALDVFFQNWNLDHNPAFIFYDFMTRLVSPYEFNPLNIDPLKDILEDQVDFARVNACTKVKIFVSATNVHTGRARVFSGSEVSLDAVVASACLPFLFQAVEIDNTPYWDGGYMGNPVLHPFIDECGSPDVLLIQINPVRREGTPTTARDIMNRVNEISFNGSLLKELRMVEFVNKCIRRGDLKGQPFREIFLHRIDGGSGLEALSPSSKVNAEWAFLTHLRDLGREAAEVWLGKHLGDVGKTSTILVEPYFHVDDEIANIYEGPEPGE